MVSYGIYDLAMTDLGDMSSLKRFNSGYRYILLVVDVLSKMVWTRPLKTKTGKETTEMMADIFNSLPEGKVFIRMQSDAGIKIVLIVSYNEINSRWRVPQLADASTYERERSHNVSHGEL